MNFKTWLLITENTHDPYKEEESNQLTQKLCTWIIKHNGRLPSKNKPMLGGTPTASGELSYDIDAEENILADFLQDRKTAKATNINYYSSDEEILAKNNMDGLFDSQKVKKDNLQINNNKIRALGTFYVDNKGTYPTRKTNSYLAIFLSSKKRAYKDFINGTKKVGYKWYPTDEEIARQAGLPSDWMISKDSEQIFKDYKQTNDDNLRELGRFYVTNGGTYPTPKTNIDLTNFLHRKRMAYKNFINGTKTNTNTNKWYLTDEEVARQAGLPSDWMISRDPEQISKDLEQTNNDKIRALGRFYVTNKGTYPTEKTNFKLANFLNTKRMAYKDFINGTKNYKNKWYPTDEEVARQAGLPNDWMIPKENLKTNDENIRALGTFYVTNGGTYPTPKTNIDLARFLKRKRQAYKDFINGTKNYKNKWYPTDEEVARQAGLPSDWMISKNIKQTPDNTL